MLPLAHLGIPLFFAKHFKPYSFPLAATAFFAVLPDVVDKSLFLLGLAPSGRFIAHTVFFGLLLAAIFFATLPKQLKLPVAAATLLGTWSHLLLDVNGPLPLLFPLFSYSFPPYELGLTFDAATIFFELIGFSCLLLITLESD
ncbi:MAG: metal-dependent hydrolase [Candidatus Micrarchaeota archaeon]